MNRVLQLLLMLAICFASFSATAFACQTTPNDATPTDATPADSTLTDATPTKTTPTDWTQWRGPNRDGTISAEPWPESISEENLTKLWSVQLEPSYSGPIVVGDRVFSTETKNKKFEVTTAFDRETGKELWRAQWKGSLSVPFFAKSNGDWIRSTPAYDEGRLYVAGMRDVLICLNAETGAEIWKVDFPAQLKSDVPSFGFVCSPLIDGDAVYVQAGGGFCKLNKKTGELIWRGAEVGGGMMGSAFSSPVIETVAGQRMAIIQNRKDLCGVDLETGKTLWSIDIPTFRGMNIITPTIFNDSLFVSAYGGTSQLISVAKQTDGFSVKQSWNLPAQGYMTTPVVIDGHAYTHLRNQRMACYDLANGKETWRTAPMGKYVSLIANGDKILALDERGELLLIRVNPKKYDLIDSRTVGDNSWAHVAIRGNQIFIRNLQELVAYQWK